ncbi:MAG: cell division protein FtsZ [Candidatus Pacebacteria bacterium]|nr:cell division protein FtsZ [Candidatus Paceibacterota bacterium]
MAKRLKKKTTERKLNRPKKSSDKFKVAKIAKKKPKTTSETRSRIPRPIPKPGLGTVPTEEEFKIRKIKIKVVGLGGGGSSVVSEIFPLLKAHSFTACDTDVRTAKKIKKGVKFFQFGQTALQGMGTGTNADLALKIALEEKERIEQLFSGQDICLIVGCLGGGVASGAGPVFAQAARNQKCISLGIFTLPFAFEGEKKMKVAKKAITELKEHLSGIIVVSNEKIFQLTDRKISLKKALSFLNQIFALWLVDLLDIVFKPSLINTDFADLKAILKDRGHILFFSQAQATGINRTEDVIKKIFQNNLLSDFPKNVKRILFNISGGKDLKLKEIEQISEEIARLNPKAKIIFGVSQSLQQKEKIKVVLLAVCDEDKKGKLIEEKSENILEKNGKKDRKKIGKSFKVKPKIETVLEKSEEKIRRTAVEVQKADEEAEKIEWATGTDWDIPAYLRNNFKK